MASLELIATKGKSLFGITLIQPESLSRILGWTGSVSGIGGAILLALNISSGGFGYVMFLLSSLTLLAWSYMEKQHHQLAMNVFFTLINIVGVYRWVIV